MNETTDVRYPFDNFLEFISGNYGLRLEGIHLTIAFLFIFIGALTVYRYSNRQYLKTISILYFCLQPFNNPSFTLLGLSLADMCGSFIAAACLFQFYTRGIRFNALLSGISLFFLIAFFHGALIWALYPEFSESSSLIARYIVVIKIAVFLMNFCWIYSTQRMEDFFLPLVKSLGLFTVFICVVYLIQITVFFTGTIPYGSFSGAGFSSMVSFGGVSIERGHLSKFMSPLLVSVLLCSFLYRYKFRSVLYYIIMLINFSASGLSFMVIQFFAASFVFTNYLRRMLFSYRGALAIFVIGALSWQFFDAYGAIVNKIFDIAIKGDESQGGGRSIGVFLKYISNYPLGIGYSASTFRTAPDLPEINMGIYAFITQLSFISILFMIALISLTFRAFFLFKNGSVVSRMLLIGAVSMPLIYSADILWFVPLWWIPLFFLLSYPKEFRTITDEEWKVLAQEHPKRMAVRR